MNWIDLLIVILLIFFAFEGFGKSFIYEIINLFSFVLAFVLSLLFYNYLAVVFNSILHLPLSLANVLGFVTVWFIVEMTLFILIYFLAKIEKRIFLHKTPLDNLSFIPSVFRGLIFISILLVLVGTFPIQPRIKASVEESILGSNILQKTHQLEVPLKNVFGGLSQDTLSFFTIKPKTNEIVDLGFTTKDYKANISLEERMIELVNQERSQQGVKPLAFDKTLQQISRGHSIDMFEKGYFSHYSKDGEDVADRANQVGYRYIVIGENLAFAPTLDTAHKGLMNSKGHRENILSKDYNKIGIGILESKTYGLMITQVFSN